MRIGIDAHVLGKNKGGVERYVEHLVKRLPEAAPQHHFSIFISSQADEALAGPARPNVRIVRLPVSDPLLQRSLILPWLIRRHRLDLIQVQRIAPLFSGRCPVLLTVHDLIPLHHRQQYRGLRHELVRRMTGFSLRRAKMILTPTLAVAEDIRHHFPQIDAPLRAFYNGVELNQFDAQPSGNESATLARLGLREPYLLTVGAIEARKNLEAVIGALAQLRQPATLAIVGGIRDDAYHRRMRSLVEELGVTSRVHWLGFVSNPDLADLYRRAELFVTPSWDEGFNIPPLEAMASGVPVLCSDIPVHRELFAQAAGFFAADAPGELAQSIDELLNDGSRRKDMVRGGRDCAARYSWEAMTTRMTGFIDELHMLPTLREHRV